MRLIDADALKKDVEEFPNCYNGWSDTYDKAFIIGAIEEQPSIDIVRCKECKYYKQSEAFCENGNGLWQAGDECFCNYGEREDE